MPKLTPSSLPCRAQYPSRQEIKVIFITFTRRLTGTAVVTFVASFGLVNIAAIVISGVD